MIAVDWGTSMLRGALLDARGAVLEERSLARGILSVPRGGFPAAFDAAFGDWMARPGEVGLMAGMVGSQQGWQEAPYCACPAGAAQIAASLAWVLPGRLAIVPGLSCREPPQAGLEALGAIPDVMRGEETQVLGALEATGLGDATLVLPGTHSKWVRVRAGRIERFTTFMTGEAYQLLREHSILARTLPVPSAATDGEAFALGVRWALRGQGLLHTAFGVRTLALFRQLAPERLPDCLSGLVIGEEIRCRPAGTTPLLLVGDGALTARYHQALSLAGVPATRLPPGMCWRGLWQLGRALGLAG